jgi:hypothetical protein
MIRSFVVAVVALAAIVSAQTTQPAPVPSMANRQLTPEQLDDLHRQAFALMRQGKFDRAGERLHRVYAAVPPDQRSRALVLNHAILDLVQKRLVMRGVKDLLDYLKQHRADDEVATNILGASLDMGAANPRVKSGPLWQAAFKEWERRNFILDHSRPGWRRWGVLWVSEQEQRTRELRQADLKQAVIDQADRIDRLAIHINSLIAQYQNAARTAVAYGNLSTYLQQVQVNPTLDWLQRQTTGAGPAATSGQTLGGWMSTREIDAEIQNAMLDLQVEQKRLRDLTAREEVFRPSWPTKFDPIDPDAPEPAAAATTMPAATQPASETSPGGLYGDAGTRSPTQKRGVP